jgi:hypothetical protein
MANILTTNPIVIDTMGADVTISSTAIKLFRVDFYSHAAAGKIVLKDLLGNVKVVLGVTAAAGGRDGVYWEQPVWAQDLYLDFSDSTFPAGSTLLIYI